MLHLKSNNNNIKDMELRKLLNKNIIENTSFKRVTIARWSKISDKMMVVLMLHPPQKCQNVNTHHNYLRELKTKWK